MTLAKAPLVPPALAFGAGIALAPLVPGALAWAAWLAALVATAALLAGGRPAWAAAPFLVGVVAVGALRGAEPPLAPDHVGRLALPRAARVEGRVVAEPVRWAADRARLLLEVERADGRAVSGRVQVTVYGEVPELAQGQRVAGDLTLHPAQGPRNPGTFDYGAHLALEGARVVATAAGATLEALSVAARPLSTPLRRLGSRPSLPRHLNGAFRRAGVYHILAVSGFNVALVAASVWALCRLARAGRRASACSAIAVVTGFAAVVGPEPSVLRAVVMAVLVLSALVLEREASVVNSLALAALAILAVRPGDLLDPGFQLSFAATAGIVLAPLPRGLVAGALGVSAAAQLAVLPIALTHFNQLSTIGVLANLGVVPLAGAATIGGLAAVGLAFASEALAAVAFDAVWPVLLALRGVVALAAAVPGAVLHLPAPPWSALACYAAALLLGVAWWRRAPAEGARRGRAAPAAALGLLAASVAIAAWPLVRPPDGRLRVTVLDVGQGDAIVVETPDGRAVLIDAGGGGPGRLDAGERVVAPFLWNRGYLRLAATAVTHLDADHAGGMPTVHRLFGVPARLTVDGLARAPFAAGGAVLSLVRPRQAPADAAARGRAANDEAMVLRLEYGLAAFLLASDIEAAREVDLVAAGAPLAATVLKVPHHGARGSSTAPFLAAVGPSVAVVSVGPRNTYGHPSPGALARLAAAGASVYRTDQDGAVLLETDGRALSVTRWAARARARLCLDPETTC